jgi:phage head maturation protease
MAWQAVKAKLVRGVSIGFRALKYSFMDNGGVEFDETEIYELSLVTIPCNASATIQTIRAMDGARRAKGMGVALIQPKKQEKTLEGGAVKLVAN